MSEETYTCLICGKELTANEAYEYRGAFSCGDRLDEMREKREWQRQEIIAEEWQDISTAPKDGTVVDLWVPPPNDSSGEFNSRMISSAWQDKPRDFLGASYEGFWQQVTSDIWCSPEQPTHWRPIPTPPQSKKK